MRRYSKYRPSGVEWIGEVPEGWEVRRIKSLSVVKRGASPRPIDDEKYFDIDGEYSWVRISDVTNSQQYLEITEQKLSILGKSLSVPLEPGVLFLSIAGSVGKPIITKIKCCIHDGFVYFPKYKQNYEYLYYIFISSQPFGGLGKLGTQLNLNTATVGEIHIPLPPLQEQKAIADFLDEKTAKIDKLIENKQNLIELLKEERTTIINRAVTKGIDPNVKLKHSGVDWLGDIPEHWEVKKLKYVVSKVGSGVTPNGGASVYLTEGVPLLRSQNILSDRLEMTDVAYISESIDEEMSNSRVQENDVLLNITGASIGRCFYIPVGFGRGNVNQHVCIIRPLQDYIITRFLYFLLISGYGQHLVAIHQNGANREGLNFQQIKNFELPFPLTTEQENIINYIEAQTSKINATISKVEKEIDLLKEYRTALISEAVTGKIKVI